MFLAKLSRVMLCNQAMQVLEPLDTLGALHVHQRFQDVAIHPAPRQRQHFPRDGENAFAWAGAGDDTFCIIDICINHVIPSPGNLHLCRRVDFISMGATARCQQPGFGPMFDISVSQR